MGLVPRFLRTVGAVEDHVSLVIEDKQVNRPVPPVPVLDPEDVQYFVVSIGPVLLQSTNVASHGPDDELLKRFAVHDLRRRHLGFGNERGIVYGRFDLGHVLVVAADQDDLVAVVITEETCSVGYLGGIVFVVVRIVPGVIDMAAAQSARLDQIPHHGLACVVFEFEQALAAGGNVARVEQDGTVQEHEHEKGVSVFPVSFFPGAVEERRKRLSGLVYPFDMGFRAFHEVLERFTVHDLAGLGRPGRHILGKYRIRSVKRSDESCHYP